MTQEPLVMFPVKTKLKVKVGRIEALRIAREILDRAERERLAIAEYEADRGIQYEE